MGGKYRGMVNAQVSKAQADRVLISGYRMPDQRGITGCVHCIHHEMRGHNSFCTLHAHRVHQMGVCGEWVTCIRSMRA